jgi:hypothetical protein
VGIGTNQVALAVFKMSAAMETHLKNLILISIQLLKSKILLMKTNISIVQGNQIRGKVGRRQAISILMAVKETGMVTESHKLNLEVATMKNHNRGRINIMNVAKKSFTILDVLYPTLMQSTFVRGVLTVIVIQEDPLGLP